VRPKEITNHVNKRVNRNGVNTSRRRSRSIASGATGIPGENVTTGGDLSQERGGKERREALGHDTGHASLVAISNPTGSVDSNKTEKGEEGHVSVI